MLDDAVLDDTTMEVQAAAALVGTIAARHIVAPMLYDPAGPLTSRCLAPLPFPDLTSRCLATPAVL